MHRTPAVIILLIVCAGLAAMLLTAVLTPVIACALFAVALAILGILSRGFRSTGRTPG
jgi:hypothetical protein